MNMRIFIDFDGTIVDVWQRYFAIFKNYFSLTDSFFSEYQKLKHLWPNDKELVNHLFHLNEAEIDSYFHFKQDRLESMEYLRLDTLLAEPDSLKDFFKKTDAKVLTIRKNQTAFFEQLDFMKIGFLKELAIVLEPQGKDTKYNWFSKSVKNEPFILIGDSEIDLKAGTLANGTAVFVKTGLRDHKSLPNDLKHFRVFENIRECFAFILAQ